ncbi:MAG: hypothetical protein ACE5FA_05520 [Dehalococcoidia bacterium]
MPVFHTTMGPFGKIKIAPQRPTMSRAGEHIITSKPTVCVMTRAWLTTDAESPLAPEFVDTDHPLPENKMSWMDRWGKDWQKEIVKWITSEEVVHRRGFVEGDPRGERPVKVKLTAVKYAELKEAGFLDGAVEVKSAKAGVTKGTRTTADSSRR